MSRKQTGTTDTADIRPLSSEILDLLESHFNRGNTTQGRE